jgi:hypothetical protein
MALVSAATLIFEVALTRVLSVTLWYHFAFLAISLAMLGLGAPGVWFALSPPSDKALPRALLLASVAAPVSVLALLRLGSLLSTSNVDGLVDGGNVALTVGLVVGLTLMVLLPLGTSVILLLLSARGDQFPRVYGADLLGATAGALLVVPLLHAVPAPQLLGAVGVCAAGALVLLQPRNVAGWVVGAAVAGLLLVTPLWALRFNKMGLQAKPEFEHWSPTAYVGVWPMQPEAAPFIWGSYKEPDPKDRVEQKIMQLDGAAATFITRLEGDPAALNYLDQDVAGLGYKIRPPHSAAIIGAGGGHDLLFALRAGASRVLGIELNPGVHAAMRGPYAQYSGNIYTRPGVEVVLAEGRSALTRTPEQFDLLQISLIDTWAATTSGAFALSENYLYTKEALRLYLSRLTPHGMLVMCRPVRGRNRLEGGRLAYLMEAVLRETGVAQPRDHMAIVEGGYHAAFLVSKTPLTAQEVAALDGHGAQQGFRRIWPPTPNVHFISELLKLPQPDYAPMTGVDLSPPTDDRPFYFHTVSMLGGLDDTVVKTASFNEHAVIVVRWAVVFVTLLALFMFLIRFVGAQRTPVGPGFWRGTLFFAGIGAGFMWTETIWVQRFVLFLGHPSYGTTVGIASLLLGAGLGSFWAGRLGPAAVRRGALVLPALLVVVNVVLAPVFGVALAAPLALRVGISAVLMGVPGLLMGLGMPTGMAVFGETHKAWFWAVNGMLGVVASVLSLALAMEFGFQVVSGLGVVAYLVAALSLGRVDAAAPGAQPSSSHTPT